jgi:hypothetical protein
MEKTGECLYKELFTWKIPHFSDLVFIPTKKKNLSLSEAFWISSLKLLMWNL